MAEAWQLIEGDSQEILPTLEAADHVITDPPYEAEAHTKERRVRRGPGDRNATVEALSFNPITEDERAAVGAQVMRLCRRWAIVFCQVEAAMMWRESMESDAFGYRRTCVWIKPDGMPQLTGDRPGMGYESIVTMHRTGRSRWNGGGRTGVFIHNKNDNGGRKNEHPTTKPLPLMLELVELFTDPGDLVLDPFAGSGTTGVACLRLGRRFIGIEKDPKYAALARERLEAEAGGNTLVAARAGQIAIDAEPTLVVNHMTVPATGRVQSDDPPTHIEAAPPLKAQVKATMHAIAVELVERQSNVVLSALQELRALQVEEMRCYNEAIEAAREQAREMDRT